MKSAIPNKKVFSWALYDWANSAFATTVMVGFFPVFFKQYWSEGADPTLTTARLGFAISAGSFLMAVIAPSLGALADSRSFKKGFLFIFMILGVCSVASLAFWPAGLWVAPAIAYVIAMMGFNSANVFYDSLLPSIASGKKADSASGLGYSLGYLGGGVLFLINILMFKNPESFGLTDSTAAIKASFLTVSIWWFLFSLPLLKNVPEPKSQHNKKPLTESILQSVLGLKKTFKEIFKNKNLAIFLVAYWLYIDGVYTVMTMSVDYGLSLNLQASDLITAILLVQFIGFPCALVFSKLSHKIGCRIPILFALLVYSIMVIAATYMKTALHFYLMAAVIGMVQGGVQALSRSLFANMIPESKSGEYFGLFNLVGKFASVLGPALVGISAYVTGNSRLGLMGLIILFAAGGVALLRVKEPHHLKASESLSLKPH